ncbi:hypothetical protein Sste5344_010084 [Sporothrix stenoceras]
MSTGRILVDETVLDTFAEKLSALARQTTVYPGASVENAAKVAALVANAVSQGARLLIVTNVKRDMEIWHTETFAPVTVLVGFKTVQEAIDITNDSDHSLSASVFTADTVKALHIAMRLDSGSVHINSITVHDEAHAPHDGVKASGWGRFEVLWGTYRRLSREINALFDEFTQLKAITVPSYEATT